MSRQTADGDLLLQDGDYEAAANILRGAGYRESHKQDTFARWSRHDAFWMDVDFQFVDANTFGKIWDAGTEAKVDGHTLRLPSLEHLIAMKLHALKHSPERQGKDLLDIMALAQENHLDMRSEQNRNLCLRFGTEELYRTITSLLAR